MMEILVFWLLLAFVVAIAAGSRGRSGAGWFILSVILSPLIGLILVLVLPNLRHERLMAGLAKSRDKEYGNARSAPFELDGVYAEVPYRVLGDGSVEALMQGGVVRFRSADHLFQTLGGGSAIETATTRAPPTALDRPDKMPPPLWKVLVLVGLVVGVILYSLKLVDDHSKQVSEAAIAAETTARNQVVDDAKALATAAEVNKKWEGTFDKAGKYPEGQNADTHNSAYGSVVRIAADSPNYREARLLVDKFALRQIKINQIENKSRKLRP
jgi:hypothetical protein